MGFMSVGTKLMTAKSIVKNEGVSFLTKKVFKKFLLPVLYVPVCWKEVKKIQKKPLQVSELVEFVFTVCKINGKGYLEPMQVKSEISSLVELVKQQKPKILLEIGSARGGTLFLFSQVAPENALLISLDMPGGVYGGYSKWRIPLYKSFAKKNQTIKLIQADSHSEDTLRKVKTLLGDKKIDFMFIDADHTFNGVKRDFEIYSPLINTGGMIAFHDVAFKNPPTPKSEVDLFWKEIKDLHEHVEFVEDAQQGWAGIGVLKM